MTECDSCKKRIYWRLSFILIFLCLYSFRVWGQNIVVEDFRLLENDVMVNTITDSNGEECALIKIETTEKGFSFEASAYGVTKVDNNHDNEIWLYVSDKENRLTIKHPTLGTLRDYKLSPSVRKGKVYLMKLSTGTSHIYVEHSVTKQYISFNVFPRNATIIVDDEPWSVDEMGHAERLCNFGEYSYRIESPQYHSTSGKIKLNNSNDKYEVNIRLKPAFGWLAVDDNESTRDADLYIDNVRIGKLPLADNPQVASGIHKVKITKNLYKMFESNINVVDSTTFSLVAHLEANFATTQLVADEGVEIWIDDKYKGKGTWNGPLVNGEYKVTCKKENHLDVSQIIKIGKDITEPIRLKSPIPVHGSLSITSNPAGAKVFVDGEEIGVTPKFISKLLIGNHVVKVSMDNYKTEEQNVVVRKGDEQTVSFSLKDFANFTIMSKPKANLYINGEYKGRTPYSFESSSGNYDIMLTCNKYDTFKKNVELKSSNPNVTFTLQRQYQYQTGLYIQPTAAVNFGGLTYGGTIGGYWKKISIEGYYMMSNAESETLYWGNEVNPPLPVTYKPTLIVGGRAGYSIIKGVRNRFIPQLGGRLVNYETNGNTTYYWGHGLYAVSLTAGLRYEYVLASHVGLSVTPEYMIPIIKTDDYSNVSKLSKDIKNLAEGLNLSVGLYFYL